MNQQPQARALPSFSGLSLAVNDARDYENSRGSRNGSEVQQQQDNNSSSAASNSNNTNVATGISSRRGRHASPTSETSAKGFDGGGRNLSGSGSGGGGGGVPSSSKTGGATGALLLQDTLSPLLEEVDALFERSKDIVASLKAPGGGNNPQEDDVEVEIMERMAEAWQAIEAKNARHDTSHKLHREKPMFCMDSLGKRIKAALLCKTLPPNDNPAEYVNGSSNAPSRNLVTAIKLAGYVVHCGTGGKVSAVDGDGREPPSKYTKEEFHNNVLPRAAENQPPRILNELRQLSCRLVASGIAKGLLKQEDLPEIRKILISRFEDGGMHFLAGGDAAFARFIGVAANAHKLLERGDIDDFVAFHERVVKLVGMCRNRVRRAAYATSKTMLAQANGNGRFVSVKSSSASRRKSAPLPQLPPPPSQQQQQQQQQQQLHQQQQQLLLQQQQQPPTSTPGLMPWRNGDPPVAMPAAPGVHGRAPPPPPLGLSGHGQHDTLTATGASPGAPFGKPPPLENGSSVGFVGPPSAGFNNGGAIIRAAMSMLPPGGMPTPSHDPNDRSQQHQHQQQQQQQHQQMPFVSQAPGVANGGVAAAAAAAAAAAPPQPPFHDHNALSAAAPEILTQMGYRRAPAFGPEGIWGANDAGASAGGGTRGQAVAPPPPPAAAPAAMPVAPAPAPAGMAPAVAPGGAAARIDSPPVLVLQPGWGVTLPPYFLGMMDPKRPRSVPVKMLWELRAEPLPGAGDSVLVEMRQVPGYLDFLAEIMPADMLKFRWSLRCWETLQGKNESRALLEEAAAALSHLGLVPMPLGSSLRIVYDDFVAHRAVAAIGV
ncbi:unnamed protein product, partial [Ectocarpus sp. 13 AM-2016]